MFRAAHRSEIILVAVVTMLGIWRYLLHELILQFERHTYCCAIEFRSLGRVDPKNACFNETRRKPDSSISSTSANVSICEGTILPLQDLIRDGLVVEECALSRAGDGAMAIAIAPILTRSHFLLGLKQVVIILQFVASVFKI
jgi:hypothetical protein